MACRPGSSQSTCCGSPSPTCSGWMHGTTSARPRCGWPVATPGPSPRAAFHTPPVRTRSCSMPRLHGFPSPPSTTLWMAIGLAASVWLVRRLELPLWWVLFPPLTHAIWNGNPQTFMLALLVAGTAAAARPRGGGQAVRRPAARLPPAAAGRRADRAGHHVATPAMAALPRRRVQRRDCASRLPGTAAPGASRCCSRRRCSRCGSCGGAGASGSASPPSSRRRSSTTCRPRSRRSSAAPPSPHCWRCRSRS